ncbi:2-methylaconitate cis-trans isomerase PrpF family protein [Pseudorhizobium pelagicum]|uniref:PrpF family protein n=1 Tax=Pseudorhizobium pelagicum TaxID=1509405 RepID=A0A922P1H5_9HYPH|nr:PrpF domain-containing protein [Pseudorhizobium pelagicum]KEQ08290.1 PrpF family protein [Pseudorhizobium pelagicum]KEQ09131.1 PrpF family protein [Pseudorhizobium pelagicum]
MTQTFVPAAFYRGGSSKGLFFHARDCPCEQAALDRMLLSALGSPDPNGRQLDGLGGGTSSLSKAVIIGPPSHPDADLDYTFGQVSVDRPVVDWGANCGNLSSAVGPFAVDEGLVEVPDGEALVRIHQVNTKKIIHSRFPVKNGKAVVTGSFTIDGVSGSGARVALDFLDPGGTVTTGLLPTGFLVETITLDGRAFTVSLVDASNPVAFVSAEQLGLTGAEPPDAIEADCTLMALLDRLRRAAGVRMGLATDAANVGLANPKIAVICAPATFKALDGRRIDPGEHDIAVRMLSMGRAHRAVTLTGAMCLAVACKMEGSLPHNLCAAAPGAEVIRVGHPSGIVAVGATVRRKDSSWHADRAIVYRTARRLMQGEVAVAPLELEPAR